ncbi:hypothetical protein [Streptomyces sp. NPDC058653]|uniref:hypothetical protein n=1 Tax=Streptomyces sp. NPDC058653 TaxID=3346576 RepID=UPI00364D7E62
MEPLTTAGLTLAGEWGTPKITATTLPIDLTPLTPRTISTLVIPATAGDILSIDARARVTNDTGRTRGEPGYTVGIGYHLWTYDVDNGQGSAGEWTRISTYNGDNVSRDRHHMPLHTCTMWRLPANWPAGHRVAVIFRADAHSTAWRRGDTITVDKDYGYLRCRRWTTPEED